MKVALVVRNFGGPGGTEKVSSDLATHLSAQGVEVHVFCDRASGSPPGVRVNRLPASGRGWAAERSWLARSAEVPRRQFDLVQGFGLTLGHDVYRAGGGVHEAWLEAASRASLWGRVARWLPRERWAAQVDRDAARSARLVVCNSERVAGEVVAWHGVDPERVCVVRNGVEGDRFRPDDGLRSCARAAWGVPRDGRVALFLGSGFRRKGLDVAVQAFRLVSSPRDRLVVIGRDARATSRIRRARATLGERLVFAGSRSDPERWLPGADACILPTLYDASANSTLEAMSCGVPPVASAMDGASELVPAELVVAEPRDVVGFAAALDRAWSGGPGLALRCREVAAEWTVARSATSMRRLYTELVAEGDRG